MRKNRIAKGAALLLALSISVFMAGCGQEEKTDTSTSETGQNTAVETQETEGTGTDKIKDIALKDAGVDAAKVAGYESELEGGIHEIEFTDRDSNVEFSYEIREDGNIIEKKMEYHGINQTDELISQDVANERAVSDAGLSAEGICNMRSEFDEGKYEITFANAENGDLYEYELYGDGTILEKGVKFGKVDVSKKDSSDGFNDQKSVEKSLAELGLAEGDVSNIRTEQEDGRFETEFARNSDGAEFNFEYDKDGTLMEMSFDANQEGTIGKTAISGEDAVLAALESMGLDSSLAGSASCREEYDDGESIFEIHLTDNGWIYEAEVDGVSKTVLEWSKEK